MSDHGYAIKTPSGIDVKTVCLTERAAKINWMVVEFAVMITNQHTDKYIQDVFERVAPGRRAKCVRVVVSEVL